MPEPNLPPLHVATGPVEWGSVSVDKLKQKIPELPGQTRKRLIEEHALKMEQAIMLVVSYFLKKI